MEGTNTSVTPTFFHGPWSSNNNNDNSPTHQVAIVDQSVGKCGRLSRLSRAKDPKNIEKMDPKMLKRVMASRNYSQKYRMKQMEYIMHLETEVKALQAEVTINSPRIKYAERQNALLRVENGSIKQKLSSYNAELMFKEAQYEELTREREMLMQICVTNRQQAQIPTGTMTMMNDAPDYQLTDMGGWKQPVLSALMDPNAFRILDQPPMMDQMMGQSFCAYGSGIVSESSNQ